MKVYEASDKSPCYIVAEAGLAHQGDVVLARQLIDTALYCDAVKFQVYKTDELIDFKRDPERYEIFKRKELAYDDFVYLKRYAEGLGITWFATPHTLSAFHFLMDLDVPIIKIGSGERGDVLEAALKCGKPLFISTGMRTRKELEALIWGAWKDVCFLHCVSAYPPRRGILNLSMIKNLPQPAGYSDHYPGIEAVEVAVSMGAKVIEKHIKLPESTGQDTECALFGDELQVMVERVRKIEAMMGSGVKEFRKEERETAEWALKGKGGRRPFV